MEEQTAEDSFRLALSHLERVQAAWDTPTDWTDLSTYGFYCLEACVVAAALQLEQKAPRGHMVKAQAARRLNKEHGLPDVEGLLVDLNAMRKYTAYGDTDPPDDMEPEDIALSIEEYVESVRALLKL